MTIDFFDQSILLILLLVCCCVAVLTNKIVNLIISLIFFSFLTFTLFIKLSYEYFGFIYILLYFGAILIFFLFVIMLLDIENPVFVFDVYFSPNGIFLCLTLLKISCTFNSIINSYEFFLFHNSVHANTELLYSTFDVFLIFFNNYYLWLGILGLILLGVMIGIVTILLDSAIVLIKIFDENKAQN